MFTEPLEDKVVRLVRKHISENKGQVATWDDEPPEPLPQVSDKAQRSLRSVSVRRCTERRSVGKSSSMKCVMVPHENHRDEALKIGVTQVLHSLTDFWPQDFGLPPFD